MLLFVPSQRMRRDFFRGKVPRHLANRNLVIGECELHAAFCIPCAKPGLPSLRAKRSNPSFFRVVIRGASETSEPGISRFRVWSFGPSRNDKENQFIVGIENSAPSLTPDGQREVTVLVLV